MKKLVLGMMLIVGSLSFASDRAEDTCLNWQDKNTIQQTQSSDEYLNRGQNKDANKKLTKLEELSQGYMRLDEVRGNN